MASEQDCLDALREAARELVASPTKAEYEDLGLTPASATIVRTVGGWNDAKELAGLSTNASTGSRVGPPPEGIDDDVRERWAELSVDQRWHYRNREWNTERTLNRRESLREWLDERAAESGCAECGESDPRCLEFHHREAAEKVEGVSEMVTRGTSKGRLREEIAKCDVLCANCHRERHAETAHRAPEIELRRRPLRLVELVDGSSTLDARQRKREWVRRHKHERGCRECGHGTAAALDLHHSEPKTKTDAVGRLVSDGCTVRQLLREVARCAVLCANCHRRHHADEDRD
jgi:hypothetical protein